jgi:two-component system cell cycle sensor histidine kinase/response regulator CckA
MNHFSGKKNQRLLVIDDNPDIHEDFRKILSGGELATGEFSDLGDTEAVLFDHIVGAAAGPAPIEPFEVDSAFQGHLGLEMVERALAEGRPYAMAFVDVRMPPGWDGVETISQIWQKYPQLQVVICTAHSDYSWSEIVKTLGASDNLVILKKPFDNIEVLQLAHAMTKKWQLTQQANARMEDLDRMVCDRTAELEAANERFTKAFTASPIPIALFHLSHHQFLDANESFLKLFQFDRDTVIGHSESDLALWSEASDHEKFWTQLQSQGRVRELKCRVRSRNGALRDVLAFAEILHINQERCLLLLFHDITELLKLEEELRHSQKMEAVGQLAAGVAHDFNNLLTVIRGHAELRLATCNLDADLGDSLTQITRAAERAASLTRQLLAFSRRHLMQLTAIDLNDVIDHLREMIESLIGEDIQLQCDLRSGLPPIHADRWSLEQVLVNIIVNARDAMPEGGRLSILTSLVEIDSRSTAFNGAENENRFVCLTIEDSGCGMDAATLNRMFEPFFTTKPVGKGTGMGLAMVYGIIKQHQGWIKVNSTVGKGTIFHIYLPISSRPVEPRQQDPAPALPGGHETILIVEDNAALRGMATNVLHSAGYRVLHASSGTEALAVWSSQHDEIDLLFSDVVMPEGMNGRTLAENLRAWKPNLKVILTSGHAAKMKEEAGGCPGALFVAKPYSASDLLKTVRVCLDDAVVSELPVIGMAR